MKIFGSSVIFVFAMLLPVDQCFAAPAPPQPSPPPPPGLPIDNGLVVLILAALIYGLFKVYQHITPKIR
jgi:hypothetical protein